ncbi:hypothetical protein E1262_27840 [Jiangella aurantiaca]|uniref:Uncharacterized protein n=1 Tax=Jiangella aurantiaca TaxID=2530373 RepID=A0A4R4ZZM0_9ACTN|nr:hypothetical protein [Jiangella aurantiaca]TDD64545.1 hypothetical protein E1262_27840 [Jiangella aurantiaca]
MDRLTARLGGLVRGYGGRLDWQAGRILRAVQAAEFLAAAAEAVDAAVSQFDTMNAVPEWLTKLRESVEEQVDFYRREAKLGQSP